MNNHAKKPLTQDVIGIIPPVGTASRQGKRGTRPAWGMDPDTVWTWHIKMIGLPYGTPYSIDQAYPFLQTGRTRSISDDLHRITRPPGIN